MITPGQNEVIQMTEFEQMQAWCEEFGDSYYVVNLDQLRSNLTEFQSAFRAHYCNTTLAYSYKTNYLPVICRTVEEVGGWAEVVSGMEYAFARRIGVRPEHTIFNGPWKTNSELRDSLVSGCIVNVDNASELGRIVEIVHEIGTGPVRIGLRCQFPKLQPSRFGFVAGSGELLDALKLVETNPYLRLSGLHTHYCLTPRSAENYQRLATELVSLSKEIFEESPPEFLSVGGGFFSRMPRELQDRWEIPIPSFADYGAAIGSVFAKSFGPDGVPRLVLEPGLAVVADAVQFVCRIISTTTRSPQTIYANATGSVYNIKPTKNSANIPMRVVSSGTPDAGFETDIGGYTCMEDDIMYAGYPGRIRVGDFCVFSNVGAYTNVLKPPFIQPAPAVVVSRNGRLALSGRQQTGDEILAPFSDLDTAWTNE